MTSTHARFSASTTGNEIVQEFADQVDGRTFLITGASVDSLGAETALSLCRNAKPAQIILLSRTESRVAPLISQLQRLNPSVQTLFFPIDLSSTASIHSAVKNIFSHPDINGIHVLINNAGLMGLPYTPVREFKDRSGNFVEMHFAANHLGPFLLTNLLIERIRQSGPGARIVNVSAGAYVLSEVHLDDLNFSNGQHYDAWKAYAQSKTANILMTRSLASKVPSDEVSSLVIHPGVIHTHLGRHLYNTHGPAKSMKSSSKGIPSRITFNKNLQQGCSTTLLAALDPHLQTHSGAYLDNCRICETTSFAKDPGVAEQLWRLSEYILGIKTSI